MYSVHKNTPSFFLTHTEIRKQIASRSYVGGMSLALEVLNFLFAYDSGSQNAVRVVLSGSAIFLRRP